MPPITRRHCLATIPALTGIGIMASVPGRLFAQPAAGNAPPSPSDSFPAQDPALVREIVGASHRDIDRVAALLKDAPRLANATWDWGFGDWETALGAASHTGRRQIAALLLDHGARPDIFTFTMLGKLDAVKAMIEAHPGLQRTRGPHGITLLSHAKAGGDESAKVAEYLVSLGDADIPATNLPISDDDRRAVIGEYTYGPRDNERFKVIARERDNALMLQGSDGAPRGLFHQGSLAFHPAGAPEVRIVFTLQGGIVSEVTITSPAPVVIARRV